MRTTALLLLLSLLTTASVRAVELPTTDGFHGIWYSISQPGPLKYKYSGGLGTYTHQTSPLAIYSADADRTYFVYGGTNGNNNSLRNYISYFDHSTGLLARPRQVRNIGGNDNHRSISLMIDDDGHVWVFGNSHGNIGSGNLYKSEQPYEISHFDEVPLPGGVFNNNAGDVKLAYSNAFYVSGEGIAMVYSQYDDGRAVHVARSSNGTSWFNTRLFDSNDGHYSLARQNGNTIGISIDYHRDSSVDNRTNLYYVQTSNFGSTYTNAAGTALPLPLGRAHTGGLQNPALVHDYLAENKLVYMKDIDFDAEGNPILFYLTVSDQTGNGHQSGPQPGGRMLHTAHWNGDEWQIHDMMPTDHNYDHGELTVDPDGTWRVVGAFIEGPQVFGTGGEVGVWTSSNEGASWQLAGQLTSDSQYNHTYVRLPVSAHDDFFAYWADGDASDPSPSHLYFSDKRGNVYQMPTDFAGDFAAPILIHAVPESSSATLAGFAIFLLSLLAYQRRAASSRLMALGVGVGSPRK